MEKSITDLRKEGRSDVEEANFWQTELHNGVLAVVRIRWEVLSVNNLLA